ncbi:MULTISPECIES: HpsJ family protein [unclassified Cyanobium]|uniref:HpsJ family protein n=1 Tax=unclassified Cyanobium TaxID=2627006 RepID=UPI0020CC9626|nr:MULTISPECIES: HpsJ family protein [unclassified Cyanobium]MCP9860404.1 HpsJ family protein [Cyanobium sp. Cruz-8H5]MCP9867714.1 HpsJ family protein [Cyanobium sp. Cruz-8D1]
MPPSSDSSRSGSLVLFSSPGLSVVALVLFVLFATLVAGAVWPVQLLNPLWQLRLASSLVNGAPFALLGLALLQIAVELGPHDPVLERRQRLCSHLAVAVALGFLLLVPLVGVAGLQQSRSTSTAQNSRISGAERRLVVLRQAVASATNNEEINQRLQRLQGPVLGPADLAQPLPLLKAQAGAVLDQAALQISREREASQPRTPLLLLPELLRNALASLALALGFAALARRPGSERSLLQELQSTWRPSRFGGAGRRVSNADGDYLRELGRADRADRDF